MKPIRLISGQSPFCETFFDDAIAKKEDLVHQVNKGWTVAKRLLQHERSGIGRLAGGDIRDEALPLPEFAKQYLGEIDGRIADTDIRGEIARHAIDSRAFRLTQRRTVEEVQGAQTPGPATSIFKLDGANLGKQASELRMSAMGLKGIGWDSDAFEAEELDTTRVWLRGKASSIAGGSNEVQMNIIAKRVLGLPD